MKVYNPAFSDKLEPELVELLKKLRQKRKFNTTQCLKKKAQLINKYLKKSNLSSCVVGVSGGIDSAVVLGLIYEAFKLPDSPIKRIVPALLPVFNKKAATNQKDTVTRGIELVKKFNLKPVIIDLTEAHQVIKNQVDRASGFKGEPWASGQLVAYTRTPALYYLTSLMSQLGTPGLLCGTTNRDEGSYLGYVGKASDGMVDLQIISDLHKSEVRKLAELLGVPRSITEITPAGDMYDGRVDEEVFGAPYDFVELFLLFKSLKSAREKKALMVGWSRLAKEQYQRLAENLEKLHDYNSHKYFVGSPSVHLDIYESGVPGGWSNNSVFK